MDVSVQSVKSDGTGSATKMASGSNQTSRIGFRGTEDLGGGLSAGFWLEGGLAINSGIGAANNTNNQSSGALSASGLQFDRRSTLSLSNSALGELRIGLDYTPTYWNISQSLFKIFCFDLAKDLSPTYLSAIIKDDLSKWPAIIKASGAKID